MKGIIAFFAGIIFSVGLVISGMTNPSVVMGFLDVLGEWNYSLVFVMGGAVMTNLILFRLIMKKKPVCDDRHYISDKKDINSSLLIGSAMFGIGWGLVGICPGPGIVNLVSLETKPIIFVAAMIIGMVIYKLIYSRGQE